MINRRLLRIKIVQLVFAYYQSGGKSLENLEKELDYSLKKTHELYHLVLLLILDITRYAEKRIEQAQTRHIKADEEDMFDQNLANNQFAKLLLEEDALHEFVDKEKVGWGDHEVLVRSIYEMLLQDDRTKKFLSLENPTAEDDRRFWLMAVRHVLSQSEDLGDFLEEMSIYWNDDAEVVLSFVEKTIKRFGNDGAGLLPLFSNEKEDRSFGRRLLHDSILKGYERREEIDQLSENWEIDRIALMDSVILQVGMTEMKSFVETPTRVIINEYIDISKSYSTKKSSIFINGILDKYSKEVLARLN